jgi:transcriptional regulator with PAS, ATPase and Fis domain
MKVLLNHTYPGNVRELENILEHALILGRKGPIELDHLPGYMSQSAAIAAPTSTTQADERLSLEARRILTVLRRHNGHRGRSAQTLGIDRTTLWRKIKRYQLEDRA